MSRKHSERTNGCAADQFCQAATPRADIMHQVKLSRRCSSIRIQVLLATLTAINLLKTRHTFSADASMTDGDLFKGSLSHSALMEDQSQTLPHVLSDSDDELGKTMAGGIISGSNQSDGEDLSGPQSQHLADFNGSGERDLQPTVAASGLSSAKAFLSHHHRAAIVRNEFGDQAEPSEPDHQMSTMLANQTESLPVATFKHQTDFAKLTQLAPDDFKLTTDELMHKNVTLLGSNQYNPTHNSTQSGLDDKTEATTNQKSSWRSKKKKKKKKKRKRLPSKDQPTQTANQSSVMQEPNRMVAYVFSQPSGATHKQPPSGWPSSPQTQHFISNPLKFVQFTGEGNNLDNLLPNYGNRAQIHLIAAYKARNAAVSRNSESSNGQLVSHQHDVAASLQRGPFELEQLESSSSSLNQRAKLANSTRLLMRNPNEVDIESNLSSREVGAELSTTSFSPSVVGGDRLESEGTSIDDSDESDDDAADESEKQASASYEPSSLSSKSGHHSSRSLPNDNEQGDQKTRQTSQADGPSKYSSNGSSGSNEVLMVQQNRFSGHKLEMEPQSEKNAHLKPSETEYKRLNRTLLDEDHKQFQTRHVSAANVDQLSFALPSQQLSDTVTQTQELLVGPFKSEAEAPATITLAGVVYQKSGSSSALIRKNLASSGRQLTPMDGSLTMSGARGSQVALGQANVTSLSDQRALVTSLWPIRQQSIENGFTGLQQNQPIYLDPAQQAGDISNTQATMLQLQPANSFTLSSSDPFSNQFSTFGDEQHLSLTAQQEASSGATIGKLTLSSSNKKPTTSRPSSQQLRGETLVSSSAGSSSGLLTTSGPLNYSPSIAIAHQLVQQPTSDSAPGTTVWTIGKLAHSMSSEEATAQKQQQLNSLLVQQAATNGGARETLAQTSSNNHSSQLDLNSAVLQTSESKRPGDKHAPIVIVQRDVKPVKYHLLRAYLKLRRLLRPFEATYVFPNEPAIGGSFLRRRQLGLGRFRRLKRVAH